MAKQTFTTGQVLTAAQMTSLQQTAMLGGSASAKTASYTLVAADAGTAITMSNAGATTITVNTGLFAAGDTVTILNIGAGVCTVTAGTATVSKPTNATLALIQNAGGVLYFTATGTAIFMPFDVGAGASGKVLQVVTATTNSGVTESAGSFVDSGLTASITPSATSSKVLVLLTQALKWNVAGTAPGIYWQLLRGATVLSDNNILNIYSSDLYLSADLRMPFSYVWLDSPNTTSSTTYKTQIKRYAGSVTAQHSSSYSSIVLLEIGA